MVCSSPVPIFPKNRVCRQGSAGLELEDLEIHQAIAEYLQLDIAAIERRQELPARRVSERRGGFSESLKTPDMPLI
jgi:hypothetical protein